MALFEKEQTNILNSMMINYFLKKQLLSGHVNQTRVLGHLYLTKEISYNNKTLDNILVSFADMISASFKKTQPIKNDKINDQI
ncbi:1514_t:CDS:2 [Entrophospora sp. SA101]|nr:1514_t:CDS:2 [Entrophospora sp. SA101]